MPKPSSTVHCSGETVSKLRMQQCMTQEILAAKSNVNIRTVQRAEKGGYLQLETVASLAAALNVTVPELSVNDVDDVDLPDPDDDDQKPLPRNAVVLHRVMSGKTLLDIVSDSFSGKLYCSVEPTADNVEVLSAMAEEIEGLIRNPWASPTVSMSLAQRLRAAVALTAKLQSLEAVEIAVFAGTYTAMAQVPRFDYEEGHMYTRDDTPFEPVTICRIMLTVKSLPRIIMFVDDKWMEPEPTYQDESDHPFPDDEDSPF
jgi:transcriptional regulator with XRE-family HTH domain